MAWAAHDELARLALQSRPACEPGVDEASGEEIEFALGGRPLALDLGARFGQSPAPDAGVEVIAGLDQRRSRQAGRRMDHPVLHRPVFPDQDRQGALGLQPQELDMLEPRIALAGHHDACPAGQAGEEARRLDKRAFERTALRRGTKIRFDPPPLAVAEVADLEKSVDKEPQAELRRQAAGAGMGGEDETQFLQVLHHIAHRSR